MGDEVIISWPVRGNTKQPALCLECFWKIEKLLNDQRDYFIKNYGFFPQFKAGLHYGPVVATLVGDIKTELVYQGDVINTAARIQQQCNVLGQKILFSESLKNILQIPNDQQFRGLGPVRLKGKQNEVRLYTII